MVQAHLVVGEGLVRGDEALAGHEPEPFCGARVLVALAQPVSLFEPRAASTHRGAMKTRRSRGD